MRLSACCIQLAFLGAFSGSVLAANFPYSEWNLANYNGAFATFSDGLVSINNGGSDYWNVQLTRKNIELQSGKTAKCNWKEKSELQWECLNEMDIQSTCHNAKHRKFN